MWIYIYNYSFIYIYYYIYLFAYKYLQMSEVLFWDFENFFFMSIDLFCVYIKS